jgi:hypothetical protein
MSGHTATEFGGVEESRFLEAYPLPWRAEVYPGTNRSSIIASDGTQVISGMNNAKAAFIAARVNSHAELVKALEEIAKGQGAFSRDPLTHASNTIDDMKTLAREALAKSEAA